MNEQTCILGMFLPPLLPKDKHVADFLSGHHLDQDGLWYLQQLTSDPQVENRAFVNDSSVFAHLCIFYLNSSSLHMVSQEDPFYNLSCVALSNNSFL